MDDMKAKNSRQWPIWARGSLLSCTAAALLLCLFSALQVEARVLYNGKSSDVFKAESTEIGNEVILQNIVDEVRQQKGVVNINIVLLCTTVLKEVGEQKDLANERIEVLRSYFQQHLTGSLVTGTGNTVTLHATQLNVGADGANFGPDMLMIQGTIAGTPGEVSEESEQQEIQQQEPWQRELLARYRKVEDKHRFLCGQKRPVISDVDEACAPNSQSEMDFNLCILRSFIHRIRDNGGCSGSRLDAEYDLERIMKVWETSGEVFSIAREIVKHKPSAGNIAFDSSLLDKEIERQVLAIKHLNRALKKLDAGLKHLPKVGGGDANNSKIHVVAVTYNNWFQYDRSYATIYMAKYRRQTIDHVRELHNYVRMHLGLEKVEDNQHFPLCVWTHSYLSEGYTFEVLEHDYANLVQPDLQKYGIADDISLE